MVAGAPRGSLKSEGRTPIRLTLAKEAFMGMMKEFKEFAVRGNVVDMAVGIIIGGPA